METIISNIEANKELSKSISKVSYYSVELFIKDAQRYIDAVKENRIICAIGSVSRSGMSRTIKIMECHKPTNDGERYYYCNFYLFMSSLGFTARKDSDYFTISGCGMDMIFHTNYTIIWKLFRIGMLSEQERDNLAQQIPNVI